MTQMLFPEIAQQIQANIAKLESELETINQSRKDKKAELKRAQKSLGALNGSGGRKKGASA
jgi:peptidoglycan hydrolase CwlO-like protein